VGGLLVRRWVNVEVLEQHNDVAGFIYAVIGVLYAVVLGFTAVIVWERFAEAQTNVEKAANELGDLFRDAQAFPDDVREELQTNLRSYVRLVIEKEWPAMAEANRAPKPGRHLTRFGRPTTGSGRRMSTRGFGMPNRSQY